MKNNSISTKKMFFARNDKDEIVNLIYNSTGLTHVALSRITGSDTYRMLNRMSKTGFIKETLSTLFSEKIGIVFYIDKFDIVETKKMDLLSWAPFFFRKHGLLVGKVTVNDKGIQFPIFDHKDPNKYGELTVVRLKDSVETDKTKNSVFVTDTRQKFLELADENQLPKNAVFIVLFTKKDSKYLTAYHSFNGIEKLDITKFFTLIKTKKVLDPEFFNQTKRRYYNREDNEVGE